jgi:hypothetical protein
MTALTVSSKPVTIRAYEGQSLSDTQIERACPSVFADHQHESRSNKYFFINTREILANMRENGLFPTEVMQSGSRIEGKAEFTKHLIRFRQSQYLGSRVLHQEVPEVVLVNSHDGTSAYQLRAGIYRLVCTNGLIKGDEVSRISVYHKGQDDLENIIRASYKIVEMGQEIMGQVAQMKQIMLDEAERLLLAKFAMMARFDIEPEIDEENVVEGSLATPADNKPVIWQPQDFLRRRRQEDYGNDLWTVTNVVQENTLGPRGYARPVNKYDNKGNKKSVRKVKGIDQSVKVNTLIWAFAEELKKQHS